MPHLPDVLEQAQIRAQRAHEMLSDLFWELNAPEQQPAREGVGAALDALDELLTELDRTGIEAGNRQAQLLAKRIQSSQTALHHLEGELKHISDVVGKIAAAVTVVQDAIAGLQTLPDF